MFTKFTHPKRPLCDVNAFNLAPYLASLYNCFRMKTNVWSQCERIVCVIRWSEERAPNDWTMLVHVRGYIIMYTACFRWSSKHSVSWMRENMPPKRWPNQQPKPRWRTVKRSVYIITANHGKLKLIIQQL